jgi:hypothetical protein
MCVIHAQDQRPGVAIVFQHALDEFGNIRPYAALKDGKEEETNAKTAVSAQCGEYEYPLPAYDEETKEEYTDGEFEKDHGQDVRALGNQ